MNFVQAIKCQGKVRHKSADAAWRAIRNQLAKNNLREIGKMRMNVYRCNFCNHWHVGKTRKK